ncbi:MAG TPA: class I SAM-dependent methyltransferase [Ignavibacteriaceae bacterium]|nr:class I SAM-dependent methyltransferase [Ignavibacteriaceae bacterium]
MIHNKDHWYDGWFYDALIAPNQDRMFREIKNVIKPDSTIIDVGCGTGRFSFSVADKVQKVVAIDLSKKNIDKANKTLSKNPNTKISFHHTKLSDLLSKKLHFDYAVMTYVIHEVNPDERITLLKEMAAIADKIIIGDYLVPINKGFWSVLNEIVEFLAGREHYTNFKNFVADDGLSGLTKKANLNIISDIKDTPITSQIFVLEHSNKF